MEVKKGTHEEYRIDLFMPIMKEVDGKYIAVLSDDSVDRDEEKLSKGCVERFGDDKNYLAALLNHDNDILNLVAEWTNKRVVEIDGHTAFVAEPKFYKSNPKAMIIKGMLDEGAQPGVSIGAIVKSYDDVNDMRVYTELELVEASFVAIPSNRHGRAMAVAKSFKKNTEELKMDKEFTQKDIDSALEKKAEEIKADFTKQLEIKDTEITKLKKDLEEAEEAKGEAEDSAAESAEKVDEVTEKLEEAEKQIKAEKEKALEKQKFANEGGEAAKLTDEEVDKSFESGKLPVMNMER